MKIWKKNLVVSAILLTVCGGIYVNWMYGQDQAVSDLTETLDSDKILSADQLVMADDIVDDNTMVDYFAAVRLSRQEARDSAVSLLQEAMAYGDEANSASSSELEDIVNTALCEAQIESLVIAKGYSDCVTYIADNAVSVAVAAPEGGLQQPDVAVISDIVVTQSGYSMDKIYVVEVK
ncbi:MAG: SpoIIIAH-like family protein [Peptococcaceae bacterium]|jgi:stage III sporulation protein AH|nr:SpoIIIAH-like family protein [Peptococcaceae bacterium]